MSDASYPVAPRNDLRGAFVWIAFGAIVVFASWRMDRLAQQGAELYTAPGLWPGIIGLLIAALGGVLAWRSVQRANESRWDAVAPDDTVYAPTSRFVLAVAMFFTYALLLVGRGIPFWLGTALFVTSYVFVFRRADRMTGASTGTPRGDAILAVVCGVATAVVVSLVFEKLFFVRLP